MRRKGFQWYFGYEKSEKEQAHVRFPFGRTGMAIGAIPLCALLWEICSKSDHGSYALLVLAYALLAVSCLVWNWHRLSAYKWGLSLLSLGTCLGLIAMLLFKKSHLYPLYPLTTTLAYLILSIIVLMAVHAWIFSVPHTMRLHFQKRYLLYGLGLIAMFFATTTMDHSDPFGPHFQLKVMVWILLVLLIVNWFLGQWRLVKALESANTTAELSHLKSQIQPHFLFNTLNNLYGLAKEKSDLTADMIHKLSELLRYGLYQANRDRVAISKEIEYLENYIALQRLRHVSDMQVTTQFDVGTDSASISPLTLIPLVENAFKHGADQIPDGAFIQLTLKIENGVLRFVVENNIHPNKQAGPVGIGLENLRKRLKLVYPDRHQFTFAVANHQARAELSIEI